MIKLAAGRRGEEASHVTHRRGPTSISPRQAKGEASRCRRAIILWRRWIVHRFSTPHFDRRSPAQRTADRFGQPRRPHQEPTSPRSDRLRLGVVVRQRRLRPQGIGQRSRRGHHQSQLRSPTSRQRHPLHRRRSHHGLRPHRLLLRHRALGSMLAGSTSSNQRPDILMQDRGRRRAEGRTIAKPGPHRSDGEL
jgi:hypothetical protein